MNLNKQPTLAQLRELFAAANDEAGDHVLWIDGRGQVQLTRLAEGQTVEAFAGETPDIRVRFVAFPRWNRYVGKPASEVDEYMQRIMTALANGWRDAARAPGPVLIDQW